MVDPEEQIAIVHTSTTTFADGIEGELDGGELLPTFKLKVRDIFPE